MVFRDDQFTRVVIYILKVLFYCFLTVFSFTIEILYYLNEQITQRFLRVQNHIKGTMYVRCEFTPFGVIPNLRDGV